MDLKECRKNLESCLGEDLRKEYFALLRLWFLFKSPIKDKSHFDSEARKFLLTEEQIRCHNHFLLALLTDRGTTEVKHSRNMSDKGVFERADYAEYIQPSSPTILPPAEYEHRSAASELFMPDSGFVSTRIAITTWENGLDGADENVTDLIIHSCQVFVKNIITAMISRMKGYKIRDGKMQYGFNMSIPNPFIYNYHNIIDQTQESKTEVVDKEDTFVPKCKPSLENAEQQAAFAYSCSKRRKCSNVLTVKLLYDTLKENPRILGLHELHSVNLFKLGLQLED